MSSRAKCSRKIGVRLHGAQWVPLVARDWVVCLPATVPPDSPAALGVIPPFMNDADPLLAGQVVARICLILVAAIALVARHASNTQ